MKKTICIIPADEEMKIFATAISILNSYKLAGFQTRRAFIEIVCEYMADYLSIENLDKLKGFWQGRVKDDKLNNDLMRILILINK